jgi:hypothetical protein
VLVPPRPPIHSLSRRVHLAHGGLQREQQISTRWLGGCAFKYTGPRNAFKTLCAADVTQGTGLTWVTLRRQISRWTGIHRGIERSPGTNGRNISSRVSSAIKPQTRASAFVEVEKGLTWYQNV